MCSLFTHGVTPVQRHERLEMCDVVLMFKMSWSRLPALGEGRFLISPLSGPSLGQQSASFRPTSKSYMHPKPEMEDLLISVGKIASYFYPHHHVSRTPAAVCHLKYCFQWISNIHRRGHTGQNSESLSTHTTENIAPRKGGGVE